VLTDDSQFISLAFDLFRKRLALAQKYNTFFATQVLEGGHEKWKERAAGLGNDPAYSFATPEVPRTKRFFKWCRMVDEKEEANDIRFWDLSYAPYPNLPGNPKPYEQIQVWAHPYLPHFTARTGGAFECRRMLYSTDFYLIEHPRSRWINRILREAETFWRIALDEKMPQDSRFIALSSFEWLWFWGNCFMRSGALTGDALSLVMQKRVGAKIRPSFYHQDCEALLMTFDDYVDKRFLDMTAGFQPKFPMDIS
jgi:hypothetical protein